MHPFAQHLSAMGITRFIPREHTRTLSLYSLKGEPSAKVQVLLSHPPQTSAEQQLLNGILSLCPSYHLCVESAQDAAGTLVTIYNFSEKIWLIFGETTASLEIPTVQLPALNELLANSLQKKTVYQQLCAAGLQ